MKPGVPFIAFSLHPDDDALHVSSLDGHRVSRNQICESTFVDLEFFNDRGLEEAANMIGKKVLMTLQLEHPEKFKRYPNLVAEIPSAG